MTFAPACRTVNGRALHQNRGCWRFSHASATLPFDGTTGSTCPGQRGSIGWTTSRPPSGTQNSSPACKNRKHVERASHEDRVPKLGEHSVQLTWLQRRRHQWGARYPLRRLLCQHRLQRRNGHPSMTILSKPQSWIGQRCHRSRRWSSRCLLHLCCRFPRRAV